MIAICVDDEALLLRALVKAVEQSPDIKETFAFEDELDAINWARNNKADVAFLDVQLHQMTGLELSQRLRQLQPDMAIVFCTGYEKYAVQAMQMHIDAGYLIKPVRYTKVQEEINHIKKKKEEEKLLTVRCFGNFEVFRGGEPLAFHRKKTKELLAYLVDRRGAEAATREICATLWENDGTDQKNLNYMYHLLSDLKKTLAEAGAEKVLTSTNGGYAVNERYLDCDYYRLLEGDESALRAFSGEYMSRYSWAEETCAYLTTKYGAV